MKLRYGIVALLCIGAVVWMLVLLQHNVEFLKPVAQAVHDEPHDGGKTMRVGGLVVPGSIQKTSGGKDFKLTQGGVTVAVHHTGDEPPQLFGDCAPAVVEGKWDAHAPGTFDSTRILIKHDNNYEPPKTSATNCPSDSFK